MNHLHARVGICNQIIDTSCNCINLCQGPHIERILELVGNSPKTAPCSFDGGNVLAHNTGQNTLAIHITGVADEIPESSSIKNSVRCTLRAAHLARTQTCDGLNSTHCGLATKQRKNVLRILSQERTTISHWERRRQDCRDCLVREVRNSDRVAVPGRRFRQLCKPRKAICINATIGTKQCIHRKLIENNLQHSDVLITNDGIARGPLRLQEDWLQLKQGATQHCYRNDGEPPRPFANAFVVVVGVRNSNGEKNRQGKCSDIAVQVRPTRSGKTEKK